MELGGGWKTVIQIRRLNLERRAVSMDEGLDVRSCILPGLSDIARHRAFRSEHPIRAVDLVDGSAAREDSGWAGEIILHPLVAIGGIRLESPGREVELMLVGCVERGSPVAALVQIPTQEPDTARLGGIAQPRGRAN